MSDVKKSSIPLTERLSYIVSRSGFTLILTLYNTSYAPLYLNTVCGIPMAAVASAMATAKLLDLLEVLFLQPVLFEWASKTKLGRYRIWFVVSPIGCLIGHLMMESYVTATVPDSLKVPFVIIGYVIINGTLNIQSTALNSMNALWIKDPTERFAITAQMNVVNNVMSMTFGFIMLPIMYFVGGVNVVNAAGMTFLVVLYNVLNIIASIPVFRFTGTIDMDQGTAGARTSPFSTIKLIASNRNVAGMFFTQTFATAGTSSWNLVFSFIFLYYYKNPAVLSAYNGFSRGIMIFSNLIVLALASKLAPRNAFRMSFTVQSLFYAVIFFFAKDAITAMVCVCINSLFNGIYMTAATPLYAEVVDYTKWEKGENITATVFSAQQATAKAQAYISNFILTAVAAIGFSASDTATHTPEILDNLKKLACFFPVGFFACALLIFTFIYNITPKKMEIARKELAEQAAENK
ncbi:MAG: MFS transporter [Eubacteriaceae bacterium]|nr:MFS transporter [Eubacteriaceae bacterium]